MHTKTASDQATDSAAVIELGAMRPSPFANGIEDAPLLEIPER